jgi:hypothetical protein
MTTSMRFAVANILALTFFLCGCGESVTPPREDLVPISGTVKLGGQPLAGVYVAFVPVGSTRGQGASAVTDETGEYELIHNATQEPGVAAGDYVVQFTKWVQPDGSPLPDKTPPHLVNAVNLIPPGWGGGGDAWPQTQIKVLMTTPTFDFDIPGR